MARAALYELHVKARPISGEVRRPRRLSAWAPQVWAMRAGFETCISKPVELTELVVSSPTSHGGPVIISGRRAAPSWYAAAAASGEGHARRLKGGISSAA